LYFLSLASPFLQPVNQFYFVKEPFAALLFKIIYVKKNEMYSPINNHYSKTMPVGAP
jgi:hypothetical protein